MRVLSQVPKCEAPGAPGGYSPRCPNARHLGHPAPGGYSPRCPNARHLGHPAHSERKSGFSDDVMYSVAGKMRGFFPFGKLRVRRTISSCVTATVKCSSLVDCSRDATQ